MPAVRPGDEMAPAIGGRPTDTIEEISAVSARPLALAATVPVRALDPASSALTTAEAPAVTITPPNRPPLPELVVDDSQLSASGSVSVVDDDDGPPPVTRGGDLTHRIRWGGDLSRTELLGRWRLLVAAAITLVVLVVLLVALL
jgi:hypothetical protein